MRPWIWQRKEWPRFTWADATIATPLARARLAQGRVLGAAGILDPSLTDEAVAAVLDDEGLATSAIEGERLVARHLAAAASAFTSSRHHGIGWNARCDAFYRNSTIRPQASTVSCGQVSPTLGSSPCIRSRAATAGSRGR